MMMRRKPATGAASANPHPQAGAEKAGLRAEDSPQSFETSERHFPLEVQHSTAIASLLESEIVSQKVAPQASAAVAIRANGGWSIQFGHTAAAMKQPVYDLASITKPFVALAVDSWIEESAWSWDSPLASLLPAIGGSSAASCTLEQLLCHRAGLLPHIELFRASWEGGTVDPQALSRLAASARNPDSRPHQAVYSDLGYILVGLALESQAGMAVDEVVRQEVTAPLGLAVGSARQWLAATPDFFEKVAPTEDQPARGGMLQGIVHDDNSWALSGSGCSGHAGLFGEVSSIALFGCYLLSGLGDEGPLEGRVEPLLRPQPGGSQRIGFDGISGSRSLAGKRAGPHTFGHLGFTGTSFWCDPDAQRVSVLLTNRVHPHRARQQIRQARPVVHDLLWAH